MRRKYDEPRGGILEGGNEKWGRYCYRPHSNRRWVLERTLIAWRVSICSAPIRVWPSGYVARRSRRCRIGAWTVRGFVTPIPTDLAACPNRGCYSGVSSGPIPQQAASRSIDAGVHRSGYPVTNPCGLNSPVWNCPKAAPPLSYSAMMLSSRRVRFGLHLPGSAGDPGS